MVYTYIYIYICIYIYIYIYTWPLLAVFPWCLSLPVGMIPRSSFSTSNSGGQLAPCNRDLNHDVRVSPSDHGRRRAAAGPHGPWGPPGPAGSSVTVPVRPAACPDSEPVGAASRRTGLKDRQGCGDSESDSESAALPVPSRCVRRVSRVAGVTWYPTGTPQGLAEPSRTPNN
jgi:hypothetical protein